MQDFFGFLFLIFILFLIFGLINPTKALFWFKGEKNRKNILKFFGIGILISFIGFGIFTPNEKVEKETIQEEKVIVKTKEIKETNLKTENSEGKIVFDSNGNRQKEVTIEKIPYKILRSWNPNKDRDAIGMDILIEKKYISEEKIKQLINEIVGKRTEVANILVFTSKNAWKEGERGSNFTDDYSKNYIAFFVKNLSGKGAYDGFNEIRWMQEIGNLSEKYGGKTEL